MSKKSSASNTKDLGPITTTAITNFRESSAVLNAAGRIQHSVLELLLDDAVNPQSVHGPLTREVTGSGDHGGRSTLQDLVDDHDGVKDMFMAEVRLGVMWQANVDIGLNKGLDQSDNTYLTTIFKQILADKELKVRGPDQVWNSLSEQGLRLVTDHLQVIEEEALDRHMNFMVHELGYNIASLDHSAS